MRRVTGPIFNTAQVAFLTHIVRLSAQADERGLQALREQGNDPLHISYRSCTRSFDWRRDRLSAAAALIAILDAKVDSRRVGDGLQSQFI
jgi:hypothetical protein